MPNFGLNLTIFYKNRAGKTLCTPASKSAVVAANLAAACHLLFIVVGLKIRAVLGGFARLFVAGFAESKLAFFVKI